MYKISKEIFIFCIIFSICLYSQLSATLAESSYSKKDLSSQLRSILKSPHLKSASVSLRVVTAENKQVLFDYKSDVPLKVASNMKLLTTSAALIYLGNDFEYNTCIYITGNISSSGVLFGNIIIKGSGDPNISGRLYNDNITAVPEMWADAIEKAGIKAISGNIVADDTIFDRNYINPTWPKKQLSNWYCAQVNGLSFNDNCVDITISPGPNPGALVRTVVEPRTDYVKIINTCKTTGNKKKHFYSLFRKDDTNIIYLKGLFWKGSKSRKEWITIDNSALYLATCFKEILIRRNIAVKGKCRLADEQDNISIEHAQNTTCTTNTISDTITITNSRSQNFYAEQLLKTIGASINNRGTFQSGLNVIKDMINKLGHKRSEYEIADGSGLSKDNKLTTSIITDLLCFMYNHEYREIFLNSLAVSGRVGTLKKRLKEAPYRSRIKAKTGYILGASALSGYAETIKGRYLTFSILVNNFKGSNRNIKKVQDSICRALIEYAG